MQRNVENARVNGMCKQALNNKFKILILSVQGSVTYLTWHGMFIFGSKPIFANYLDIPKKCRSLCEQKRYF